MARKKNITKKDIIAWYMEYVLEQGKQPNSVLSFAKSNNFEESLFYQFFGSFDAIESGIFKAFFDNTEAVLEKSEEYNTFDSKNKLLTFYFTFFENLTANRSYVVYALDRKKHHLKTYKALQELKRTFGVYIEDLGIEFIDFKEKNLDNIQSRGIQETAWIQLLVTLKFWLEDSSPSFEKTDIFIEKSIKASFDLIDTAPLKSIVDFGKFIFKERFQMN